MSSPAPAPPRRPLPCFFLAAASKKQRRKEAYQRSDTLPPAEDPRAAGARGITRGEPSAALLKLLRPPSAPLGVGGMTLSVLVVRLVYTPPDADAACLLPAICPPPRRH